MQKSAREEEKSANSHDCVDREALEAPGRHKCQASWLRVSNPNHRHHTAQRCGATTVTWKGRRLLEVSQVQLCLLLGLFQLQHQQLLPTLQRQDLRKRTHTLTPH